MQERIERTDPADEPVGRFHEHGRDDLRQRLERLADRHPSSNNYRDSGRTERDGRADVPGADNSHRDVAGQDAYREETTGTRRDDASGAAVNRGDTGHHRDDNRDASERAGWESTGVREHRDRPAVSDIHLTADRAAHILDGDGPGKPGGGHRYGMNRPGKTEFPESWPDDKIIAVAEDVSRSPDVARWQQDKSRWVVTGERDGVQVSAVVLPDGRIWAAWPQAGGAGVRQNPQEGAV